MRERGAEYCEPAILSDIPPQPTGLKNGSSRGGRSMAAQLACFLLGACAPLAIVGWLLVLH
jgi:hypothetical protein